MSEARAGRVKRPTSFLPLQTQPVLGWADALMGPWKSRQSSRTSIRPSQLASLAGKREASRPPRPAGGHRLTLYLHSKCHGADQQQQSYTTSAIWSRSGIRGGQAFLCCCQSPDCSGAHQLIGGQRPGNEHERSRILPAGSSRSSLLDHRSRKKKKSDSPPPAARPPPLEGPDTGSTGSSKRRPIPRQPRGQAPKPSSTELQDGIMAVPAY